MKFAANLILKQPPPKENYQNASYFKIDSIFNCFKVV